MLLWNEIETIFLELEIEPIETQTSLYASYLIQFVFKFNY